MNVSDITHIICGLFARPNTAIQGWKMTDANVQRRTFLKGLGGVAGLAAVGAGTLSSEPVARAGTTSPGNVYVYVGAWNNHGGDEGLWLYEFNQATGKLKLVKQISNQISSDFIYIDRARSVFYVPDESDLPLNAAYAALPGYGTGGGGRIFTYQVDNSSGNLTQLGVQWSFGSDPAMVWPDPTGQYLVSATHTNGGAVCTTVKNPDGSYSIVPQGPDANIVLFPLGSDGTIGDPVDIVTWPKGALPQALTWEPKGRFFLATDRGLGKLYTYKIDYANRRLQLLHELGPGTGTSPRYIRFHPTKPWVYINHETTKQVPWAPVNAYRYNGDGVLTPINTALAVPDSWKARVPSGGQFEQQDLKLDAGGKFLYSVYRSGVDIETNGNPVVRSYINGFEGIAVFKVDQRTGAITNVQRLPLDSSYWLRGAAISPNGKWLIVASLFSNELITLAIGSDGHLSDTGIRTPQTTAASVTFYAPGDYPDDGVSGGFF